MNQTKSWKPWIVVFSAATFFFYTFIQMNMFNAIGSDIEQVFHAHGGKLGWLSGIFFCANVVFLLPAAILLDRFSTKKIILIAMFLSVLGTMLFANSNYFSMALVGRFLTGIGSAFVFISCIRIATRWFPGDRLALVTGLIITFAFTGGMIAQTPLILLKHAVGWRTALMMDAGLGLFLMVIIAMFVQDYPAGQDDEVASEQQELDQIGYLKSVRLAYSRMQNWLAALYTCMMNLPLGLLGVIWGVPFLTQAEHLTSTQAGNVTQALFLGAIVGSPVMGAISDKLGNRRLPMMLGAIASLIIFFAVMFIPGLNVWWLMLLFATVGFVSSTQVIAYPAVAESNPAYLTATAISCVSLLVQGGSWVLQPLFGRILEHEWDGAVIAHVHIYSLQAYQHALWMIPVGFIIAALCAWRLKETHISTQEK